MFLLLFLLELLLLLVVFLFELLESLLLFLFELRLALSVSIPLLQLLALLDLLLFDFLALLILFGVQILDLLLVLLLELRIAVEAAAISRARSWRAIVVWSRISGVPGAVAAIAGCCRLAGRIRVCRAGAIALRRLILVGCVC